MSDEGDSISEGFSASEEEWKPSKGVKGGESSDDDDSDFEGWPLAGAASADSGTSAGRKSGDPKARGDAKQTPLKKRSGLSRLYNKCRPQSKKSPLDSFGKNSPSASTSRTDPKTATPPSKSKSIRSKTNHGEDYGSSSDSSIGDYLVNPEDLEIQSSFFNVESKRTKKSSASPVPVFDCNAGLGNLSDSSADDEKIGAKKDEKAFDFKNLLEYAKSLERAKESVAKYNAEESNKKNSGKTNIDALNVYAALALGESQQNRSHNDGEDEDDEDDEGLGDGERNRRKTQPSKLSKTKSTRIKRHTKTRPTSTAADNDTDESDWEEVADSTECDDSRTNTTDDSKILEIHVELPSNNRVKKTQTQQDIENAFKRKLNRDMKDRQVLLHKASLLCHFGRTLSYNRLLNNTILMQNALKLLPTKSAYPNERGTEIKYFQSMVKWFKTAVKLKSQNLYPKKSAGKTKAKALVELLTQIEKKEASCKQNMVFIFIILLRGMGLQCRLIVNMQPIPLKVPQSDLLTINMKKCDDSGVKSEVPSSENKTETDHQTTSSSKPKDTEHKSKKKETTKRRSQNQSNKSDTDDGTSNENKSSSDISKTKTRNIDISKRKKLDDKKTELHNKATSLNVESSESSNKNGSSTRISKQTKSNTKINDGGETKSSNAIVSNAKKEENDEYEDISKENSKSKANKVKKIDAKNNKAAKKTQPQNLDSDPGNDRPEDELNSSQKENCKTQFASNPNLARLKRNKTKVIQEENNRNKKPTIASGSAVIPKIIVHAGKEQKLADEQQASSTIQTRRNTRSRSKSPQAFISTAFLLQGAQYKDKFPGIIQENKNAKNKIVRDKNANNTVKISTDFLKKNQSTNENGTRVLRSRSTANKGQADDSKAANIQIPQLDGANDSDVVTLKSKKLKTKLNKFQRSTENSDEDFEPSPSKKPKVAPTLAKQNRQIVSPDHDSDKVDSAIESPKRKQTASDMWVEVWCDVEEQWVCVDIFNVKIHCVDTIRKSASPSMAYVFAFQNDLSIKDVTARYCTNWATVIRKSRVDEAWLGTAISKYMGIRTMRDIKEDHELRRIHAEKPMPTSISDYKNHPFYALERHLLKFEAIYPPNAPTLGYIRKEPVYSRDCVHTLHSREIWLKQARTVKLGEKPYKIVKARPKWDRITQTVIKDLPLEIFGYWQTQDYEPPTAENGLVPRNAYGNVELFKPSMLPKKTKHIRLPGIQRICKKLGIDCANAVVGFDFHQGSCHPTYDGFVICEEFEDQVLAAWHQDQEDQDRKEQEKYEARVYGNWKKLIRGVLIRQRLKLKYNV